LGTGAGIGATTGAGVVTATVGGDKVGKSVWTGVAGAMGAIVSVKSIVKVTDVVMSGMPLIVAVEMIV